MNVQLSTFWTFITNLRKDYVGRNTFYQYLHKLVLFLKKKKKKHFSIFEIVEDYKNRSIECFLNSIDQNVSCH